MNSFIVQGSDPAADVKCTLNFLGASVATGLIFVTSLTDNQPSMAIGQLVQWPMSWQGMACGYEAAAGGFETDINLQQVPAVSPAMIGAGATYEALDHVAAFGERAGRGDHRHRFGRQCLALGAEHARLCQRHAVLAHRPGGGAGALR